MIDIEKLRKRYQGPLLNQDIMNCIEEIEQLRKALERIDSVINIQSNHAHFTSQGKFCYAVPSGTLNEIRKWIQQVLKEG